MSRRVRRQVLWALLGPVGRIINTESWGRKGAGEVILTFMRTCPCAGSHNGAGPTSMSPPAESIHAALFSSVLESAISWMGVFERNAR